MTPRIGVLAVLFLSCILAANYVTSEYGMVWVFGLTATAGTYFAGLTFIIRDSLQDTAGRWATIGLITVAGVLSYLIADPFIALASATAFAVGELVDMGIYTPLRHRGYIRAAVASNIVGAVVDTYLFLWIAGFGIAAPVVAGQVLGKVVVMVPVIVAVILIRAHRTGRLQPA